MKSSLAVLMIALLSADAAFAFAPLHQSSSSSRVALGTTAESIKKAGGGIPLDPPGKKKLFDPNSDGKLQGTGACDERISSAYQYHYLAPVSPPTVPDVLDNAQHWLEDIGTPPPAFAKATQPASARVLGRARKFVCGVFECRHSHLDYIVGIAAPEVVWSHRTSLPCFSKTQISGLIAPDAPGDIQHILLQLPKGMHYIEGQSISVIPPGVAENGKKHKPRLYSIASTRYGDAFDGETVSLCVRRAVYMDPVTGREDPSKKGICSNFLCDTMPGTPVEVAGPVGKTMLLPQDAGDKDWAKKDIIMVATGTGIAPFRGFLRRLFLENTVARHLYQGTAWLVLGVPTTGSLLYQDEWNEILSDQAQGKNSGTFRTTYAISREMQNSSGGKLYVQDVLAEHADELFHKLLNEGAIMYFCGLKGMMPGILDALEKVATERGLVWNDVMKQLKANGQCKYIVVAS